ncbi:MAG: serine/threonine protein kinase, partial [Myxococcales bacterium]|nr:serine/threonine protein kinase [Myxococcales bacterium]
MSDAFAPTAPGDATEAEALRGLEVRRLEARVREALFGRIAEPVRIGRFVVLERIGEGGMGVVYSAYDDALERKVAIKLVRPQLESDDGQRRIRREAQAAARLSHPNVVTVYEIGEHAGRVFVAMEFVRGRTLRQWLAAAPRPWQGIVDVFVDAGRGLQAAHAAGLVHRDFKPDNVMIDDDEHGGRGRVRVLDFGVARRVGAASAATGGVASTESEVTGTDAGRIVGTPAYMAPEQLAGELADARSDQYAFCLSLWLALFGESPFEDDAARRTGLVRSPSRPHRVPARVRSVLERGLAFRAEDRHSSMQAVIAGLVAARRRRWRWAAAAAATLICGIAIAGWWRRAPSECERAAAQLDDVWSDAARGRIAARVGPDAWSSVEPALAAHVEAWREAHAAACRDAVDGPDALQQRRCLAADAEAVRGVLAALEGSGLEAEAGALAAVRGWESPESCLEPDALRRWADRQALMDAPPPVGSEDGLVSDFDAEPMVRFGFGW